MSELGPSCSSRSTCSLHRISSVFGYFNNLRYCAMAMNRQSGRSGLRSVLRNRLLADCAFKRRSFHNWETYTGWNRTSVRQRTLFLKRTWAAFILLRFGWRYFEKRPDWIHLASHPWLYFRSCHRLVLDDPLIHEDPSIATHSLLYFVKLRGFANKQRGVIPVAILGDFGEYPPCS